MTPEPHPIPNPAAPSAPPDWLETCFREHGPAVFRAALRVTGNASDAEDVVQTVFVRLARRAADEPLGADAGGYLHRSAVHAGLDVLRARHRAGWVPLEAAPEPISSDPGIDPERTRRAAELRRHLRLALARLSPRSAELFALRYFEGMDNATIARLLEISPGLVGVLLHRTRTRLRKDLAVLKGDLP